MKSLCRTAIAIWIMALLSACAVPPDDGADEGIVATFLVAGVEEYRIQLTDPADIEIARKLLAGEEAPNIPNGVIIYGDPSVNIGYSWHIDPDSVEFAEFTTEVCDGLPSHVEEGTVTSDRYCPWSAEVVAIEE